MKKLSNFKQNPDRLDQHFLIDENVIQKIIESSNLKKSDIVVEVGPGNGVLTKKIVSKVQKLYCIELDQSLKIFLNRIKRTYSNVELIYENVLTAKIPTCNKLITALPYSIVEPFIQKISHLNIDEIIMITGNKFVANVCTNKINKLSLYTNCYFKVEKIMDILPESFDPKPRVLSSMIKLKPQNLVEITDIRLMIFRYLFYYKSKKVKNALIETFIKINENNTKNTAKDLIFKLNIEEKLLDKRFETFSNNDIGKLYDSLKEIVI